MKAEELYRMSTEERRKIVSQFTPEELETHAAELVELLADDIEDFGDVLSPISVYVLKAYLEEGQKALDNHRNFRTKAQ